MATRMRVAPRGALIGLAFTLSAVASSVAETGPFIARSESTYVLVLPEGMRNLIEKRLSGFSFWTINDYGYGIPEDYKFTMRQVPWAVIGDFNGDGFEDVVADGHVRDRWYRICVWGKKQEPELLVLDDHPPESGTPPLGAVLMYVAPGEHGTNFSDESTFIFTDAFFDYTWEKGGSILYWKDGHFEPFFASD